MALLSPAVSSPSTPYKLRTRMDNEEGIALIRSFQWAVDVECLVDGELFLYTDVMNVEVKAREGDPAPCLVVTIAPPQPVATQQLELLVVLKAFRNGVLQLRWSSLLNEDAHESGPYDVDSADLCSKEMDSAEGFHTARALYSRVRPRRWVGINLSASALGIHRAMSVFE